MKGSGIIDRRRVLVAIPGIAAGARLLAFGQSEKGSAADQTASIAQEVPWSAGIERPHFQLPEHATDCHHHIYNPGFPPTPGAMQIPAGATTDAYRQLQKRLGIQRHVVVQPSHYGVDNAGLFFALGQFGRDARGVAVVNTSVTERELKDLDAAGVRGLRFNSPADAVPLQMLPTLARMIEPMGWHVQVNARADHIVENKALWSSIPCPIVFDHIAKIPYPEGVNHPAFGIVSELLQKGKAWLKLSAAYTTSKSGPPGYSDTVPVARAFIKAAPERIVWGSDWPHPSASFRPDDAGLVDMLSEWAPDVEMRRRILVENPASLYGFQK